jgi:hypothetical protein
VSDDEDAATEEHYERLEERLAEALKLRGCRELESSDTFEDVELDGTVYRVWVEWIAAPDPHGDEHAGE